MDRLRRHRAVVAVVLALAALFLPQIPVQAATRGSVVVLPAVGEIDGLLASGLVADLQAAADGGAAAVVIRLDTPGGSLEATQRIVSALLAARVPTIVWVAPAGGFAASAGTFITMAANLAYMAPATRIGAASPIDSSGQDIPGTLGEKVKNDAIAWMTSIAETRHRPVDWAAATVAEARSSSAQEAVSLGAVDGIASTIEEVVAAANGQTVQVGGQDVVLELAGAPIAETTANPFGGLLRLLVDPNIAFLLFTIGALALLFELQNPNVLTGVFGLTAIALAVVGFVNLPTDLLGLVLVSIGLVLFALEPAIPSHGLLTVAGAIAFVLGGSALYSQADRFGPDVRVATPFLVGAVVTAAGFGLLIAATALRTRQMAGPADVQPAALSIGMAAVVRRPLEPLGSVYAAGEEWSARAVGDDALARGTPVHVVRTDGLTVIVESDPAG